MIPFEIRSLPTKKSRRLFLIQLPYKTSSMKEVSQPTTIAAIDGSPLDAASGLVLDLVGNKVDASPMEAPGHILDREFTVAIEEDVALRLGLLFASINTLRSDERIQEIIDGVQGLDADEAAFWLGRMAQDESGNMLKAFRVAMTGEA